MMGEWAERTRRWIDTHGPYVIFKTLLGGEPDCNRRDIYDLRADKAVATFNPAMQPWTQAMESAATEQCRAMNEAYFMVPRREGRAPDSESGG